MGKRGQEQLDEYQRKRDFELTSEPSGGGRDVQGSGHRFVVQKHAASRLHYDFRLEMDGVLKSWAVPRGPSLDPKQKPLAVHTEDHPLEYASFEGVIPKGQYGGGTVMIWDRGDWDPIGDPSKGYGDGDLKFRLHGEKLRGTWVLARMTGKQSDNGKNWLLIKKVDEESRTVESFNILGEMPHSVVSGRTLDEIAAAPEAVWMDGGAQPSGERVQRRRRGPDPAEVAGAICGQQPDVFKPQLATAVQSAPDGDRWLHEIKLDGYRLIAHVASGKARLLTRNGHDWTDKMPAVAAAVEHLPVGDAILDGEVTVLNRQGVSDFQALQNAFRGYAGQPLTYIVFDLPFADGYDLRRVQLVDRKTFLRELLEAAPLAAPTVQYCDHIVGRGPLVFDQAAQGGLEGIISKRVTSSYESRRTDTWLKVKALLTEEFVVAGHTDPSGSRSGFGAIILGQYNTKGELIYCGRAGTGFSDQVLEELSEQFVVLGRSDSALANPKADPDHRSIHWVDPALVAVVSFGSWTGDGVVRHPSYKGLREDKAAAEVILSDRSAPADAGDATGPAPPESDVVPATVVATPNSPADAYVEGVRISNPSRTVYPDAGVTKLDVAEYYKCIAELMLPHVAGRPLSLVRCPLGLAGESFYQREIGKGFPDAIRGVQIGSDHALMIDDVEGLLSLVQMGVLEIHAWQCRNDNTQRPDQMVFDLDPGPEIEWEHMVESAQFIRSYLESLGLRCFVKTTGGSGIHLVVPVVRRSGWAETKGFSKAVADDLARLAPLNFVSTMSKAMRQNRIFIDYLRNQEGATAVAPYSTRARSGATVSTPLSWEELSADVPPTTFTVTVVQNRTEQGEDPWAGFHATRQSITRKMRKSLGLD